MDERGAPGDVAGLGSADGRPCCPNGPQGCRSLAVGEIGGFGQNNLRVCSRAPSCHGVQQHCHRVGPLDPEGTVDTRATFPQSPTGQRESSLVSSHVALVPRRGQTRLGPCFHCQSSLPQPRKCKGWEAYSRVQSEKSSWQMCVSSCHRQRWLWRLMFFCMAASR